MAADVCGWDSTKRLHSGQTFGRVRYTSTAMGALFWIVASSLGMSLIALIGLVTVTLKEEQLRKLLLPLVAFSAGSLIGAPFDVVSDFLRDSRSFIGPA